MRCILFALTLTALLMVSLHCGLLESSPSGQASDPDVPFPDTVLAAAVPQPFTSSTYFLYGGHGTLGKKLGEGGEGHVSVLEELLRGDVAVKEAWYPNRWKCAAPLLDRLIVQLDAPDSRMDELGFTSDSSDIRIGCWFDWLHYDFKD